VSKPSIKLKSPSKNIRFVTMLRTTVILLVICIAMSGCANLAPWERGTLAKSHMAVELDPLQSIMRAHNYGAREAGASVNSNGGGGGCGCS
jgi:hypothetical protein